MKKTNRITLLIGGLFLGFFVFGILTLIQWEFERGDMYPRMSSLRSDPLGSRVLYEALDDVEGVNVERNFKPWDTPSDRSRGTALFLNFDPWDAQVWSENPEIIDFVASGGRVVFGLNPARRPYYFEASESVDEDEEVIEDESIEDDFVPEPQAKGDFISSLFDSLELTEISEIDENSHADFVEDLVGFSGSTHWRKRFGFDLDSTIWQPVLVVDDEAVAAYRTYGRGSIVLLGDDYLFTNEALYLNRSSDLLYWLVGDARTVIFDEAHFGIVQNTGIMDLVKKYNLLPVMLVAAILLLVWIWKNALPLLPAEIGESDTSVVFADSSSDSGFSELINRSVPRDQQPVEAFELWKKAIVSNSVSAERYSNELKEAEQAIEIYRQEKRRKRDPNALYFKLKNILNSQHKVKL